MTMLVLAGAIVYSYYGDELLEAVLVPDVAFEEQVALKENVYAEKRMWFARPDIARRNPARWLPATLRRAPETDRGSEDGTNAAPEPTRKAAVFFLHPTSFIGSERWNAPLNDSESQARARIFLRGQATAFNAIGEIWAPRYRQATLGAFLTEKVEGEQALDAAYKDVLAAFDYFIEAVPADRPIVLAGHSQGSLHLTNLLKDRVAGTPLASRIVAAYVVGWPVSLEADVPAMGLPVCETAEETGCILSWVSFAEPADYGRIIEVYDTTIGFTGTPRGGTELVCTNPINGDLKSEAAAADNLGTLKPNDKLSDAELVAGSVPARCDERGFLLIGDPPDIGPYALPGNNYHVYDYSLFWANVRADAARRMRAFLAH